MIRCRYIRTKRIALKSTQVSKVPESPAAAFGSIGQQTIRSAASAKDKPAAASCTTLAYHCEHTGVTIAIAFFLCIVRCSWYFVVDMT